MTMDTKGPDDFGLLDEDPLAVFAARSEDHRGLSLYYHYHAYLSRPAPAEFIFQRSSA